ncbi:MAG: type II secretion system protein GspM [Pseudomonadota bacterium]
MMAMWYGLGQTARQWLSMAIFILMMLLLYVWVWSPWAAATELQQQRVEGAEENIRWLLRQSAEVHALGGGKSASLNSLLDTSLDRYRLRPTRKTSDPRTGEWQLDFTAVDFRNLLLWLNRLRQDSLATIASADIKRLPSGQVQARLILTE